MARPYKEDELVTLKKDFLHWFEKNDGAVYDTCRKIGVTNYTYLLWKKSDPEFAEKVSELEGYLDDRKEGVFKHESFNKRNITGMIYYLKKKMKHRGYGDDPMTTNIHNYNIDDMDKDAIIRVGKELEKREKMDGTVQGSDSSPVSVQEPS